MEVGHDVVSIMKNDVNRRISKDNTSQSPDSKQEDETEGSKEGRSVSELSPVKGA